MKILENFEASYGMIPLMAEINVALRIQICQKIGSERVKGSFSSCVKSVTITNILTKLWKINMVNF